MVPINYLAVLVAAIASMVLGFLWFGPIFGKKWIALMGFKEAEMMEARKKSMVKTNVILFVGALVMSFVLAHALIFASTYLMMWGVSAGIMAGFWNWLGFIAPVTLGTVLFDGRSWKLWFLNNGYWLLSLMIMGVILSLWA
jgi:hypothetical protein